MSEIKIIWAEGYGECDDCGGYEGFRMAVELDGAEIDYEYGDGHLSGTYSDPLAFREGYVRALQSLGHNVELVMEHSD